MKTQELDDTTLRTGAKILLILQSGIRFVSILCCNKRSNFLFLNAPKIYPIKAKVLEIKTYPLCLGNISKTFTIINSKISGIKKTLNV